MEPFTDVHYALSYEAVSLRAGRCRGRAVPQEDARQDVRGERRRHERSIRPAFDDAYHEIRPVDEQRTAARPETVDVIRPICASGDFLTTGRARPRVQEGDLLDAMSAGAHGFAKASNDNARPRAAEVLVQGDRYTTVRRRESCEDLVAGETTV